MGATGSECPLGAPSESAGHELGAGSRPVRNKHLACLARNVLSASWDECAAVPVLSAIGSNLAGVLGAPGPLDSGLSCTGGRPPQLGRALARQCRSDCGPGYVSAAG